VRVALNDEFAPASTALRAGDCVVFVPPVAGG
jgi:molybdopterin converting factor small subunit